MEWKLQDDYPSTFEFHEHRERANHLIHQDHNMRLRRAARMIRECGPSSVVDLGCGDGGLLKLLDGMDCWGYDFTPANIVGCEERGVDGTLIDVFNTRDVPRWGQLVVMTEVLEHLANPHDVLEWVSENCEFIVVSSPWGENPEINQGTDPCHIWAWDWAGYEELIRKNFSILWHEKVDWSQLILARSKNVPLV